MLIGMLLVLWANVAQAVITGTITMPAGGEMWAGSSTHDIVWETSGGSETHTAELWLSTDGGTNYTELIGTCTHTAIGGTYTWTLLATNTTNAKIMVMGTDSADTTFTVISGTFTIDSIPPINPTACTATVSATDTTQLTNCAWQNLSAAPYFEWAGATDTVSGVAGYSVYWGANLEGEPGTAGVSQTTATYSAASAVPDGGTYCLRVRTWDNAGNWSTATTLFTSKYDVSAPTNPTACTATVSATDTTQLTNGDWQNLSAAPYFEWAGATDTVSGVAGYSVYWGADSEGEPGTAGVSQTVATYSAASAVPDGGTYCLRVRTKDNAGNWSTATTLFTSKYDVSAPTNPTACTATVSATDTTQLTNGDWQNLSAAPYFEWAGATDTVSGVAGYSVYWGANSEGEPGTAGVSQTAATYSAASAVPDGGTYCLRVRTWDNAGNWGTVTTLFTTRYDATPPWSPQNLKANGQQTESPWDRAGAGTFTIDWTNPSDTSGIKGAWFKYGSVPGSSTDGIFTYSKPFIATVTIEGTTRQAVTEYKNHFNPYTTYTVLDRYAFYI